MNDETRYIKFETSKEKKKTKEKRGDRLKNVKEKKSKR